MERKTWLTGPSSGRRSILPQPWQRLVVVILLAVVVMVLVSRVPNAAAQSGGGYELTWSTIDGGGYMFSTGGGYSLGGTVGQPDAGVLAGGSYTLAGGFWSGTLVELHIHMPLLLKQYE